ncbi:MAG: 16S rRNA (cytosine(1402)-N(4))-methyltransferase RsmH [Nitrospirae bacterium]|nr:16S rRNA (cytosine(1402)-N(4))-methyltransferase RsmH [Nitrospirota bacterium]
MLHKPVLLAETIQLLNVQPHGVYVDATLGSGGHTREILNRLGPEGRVVGIDRDQEALERVERDLRDPRLLTLHTSFSRMARALREKGIQEVDGVIMDLGVSMEQLKDPERGFSFHSDARLDMRMDKTQRLTAEEIVNRWSQQKIERIIREYGEERYARPIAKAIIDERKKGPIYSCRQLAEVVQRIKRKRTRIHPATKTFQALRIAVNNELEELQKGLENSLEMLKKGGRLCVISYHSLEDRIVKRFFVDTEKKGLIKRLTKKPLLPTKEEIRDNPSARSAKLRGGERI